MIDRLLAMNGPVVKVAEFDSLSRLAHDGAGHLPSSHP